jgi:SOS-response transcriptional repressor LexA
MNEDLARCGASEPFALRVLGDDMAPEFVEGHIVVVDPGGRVLSGCYVVARIDGEAILRQLIMQDDGCLLVAAKPSLPAIELPGLDAIVGVVSQRAGRRRREHKRYDV